MNQQQANAATTAVVLKLPVESLRAGDEVDLSSCPSLKDHPAADSEYGIVEDVERETADGVLVFYENFNPVGYPLGTMLVVATETFASREPKCECCGQPAIAAMPQSTDQGKTVKTVLVCADHRAGWWSGADWEGRHLEVSLTDERTPLTPQEAGAVAQARTLVVDGTDEYGNFAGDGEKAPFVVFDVDRQQNIAGPFATREEGDTARAAILGGAQPVLDVKALQAFFEGEGKVATTVREAINATFWPDLHPDIAGIEPDSTVGEAVVAFLNDVEAICTRVYASDYGAVESDIVAQMKALAYRQCNVWYFG